MVPLETVPPFARWHLDFIRELPTTVRGNNWLLVAVDSATNWSIARALPEATGEAIAKFLYEEITMRFGCPQEIFSDRGPNFMSNVIRLRSAHSSRYSHETSRRASQISGSGGKTR